MASDFSLAFDGSGLPESDAALGVHVDSFARHLPQPEVADVVETRVSHAAWRSVAYLLAWPGMDADAFLDARQQVSPPAARAWLRATFETILGAILFWVVARSIPLGQPVLRGRVGMVGLILILNFGGFQTVALLWQTLGLKAEPIMSAPLHSTSLTEFWGKWWNLGFRQLAHELIFRPL